MKLPLFLLTVLAVGAGGFLYFQPREVARAPSLEECIEQIIAKTEGAVQSVESRELSFQCAMRSQPVLAEGNLTPDQQERLSTARMAAAERRETELLEKYPNAVISELLQGGDTPSGNDVFDATRTALTRMDCTPSHFLDQRGWTRSTNYSGAGERFFVWCGTGNRIYWDTTQNTVFRR